MNSSKTVLFGAVVAVAAGLFGANFAEIYNDNQKVVSNSLTAGAPIFGHVTIVKKDMSGKIVAYIQGDNLIVNMGLNCMGQALFRTVATISLSDPDNCGGSASAGTLANFNTASGFVFIEIGSGSGTPASTAFATATALGGAREVRTLGTASFNAIGTGSTAQATGAGPTIIVRATISGTQGTETINEAGLFDGGSGAPANMFARQTFVGITMAAGDTLTVTWTITLAHG
jgi:hypothetical protein